MHREQEREDINNGYKFSNLTFTYLEAWNYNYNWNCHLVQSYYEV